MQFRWLPVIAFTRATWPAPAWVLTKLVPNIPGPQLSPTRQTEVRPQLSSTLYLKEETPSTAKVV